LRPQPAWVDTALDDGNEQAGAHGSLRKGTLPEELCQAIRDVHAGRTGFSPPLPTALAAARLAVRFRADHRLGLLTRRERDVLAGIATGRTNREIAAWLGVSVRSVESYRESLIRTLGIPSVAGLTRFALEAGLVGR
jgi:DNA-binding NarL/FixJ family response regulator